MVDERRPGAAPDALSLESSPVLFVTPRWTRDGGVAAHAVASAALLARHGIAVRVLTARVESDERPPGVTLLESPRLCDPRAAIETRIDAAMSFAPGVVHIHQLDDPELVRALRTRAPVAISAHGYTACTSGVHYFRPGHECDRGHGVGCIGNLVARGCAHTRHPKTLPNKYRRSTRALAALGHADLAISYSGVVDRHLAANGIARRRIVPLFPTVAPSRGSGHATRRRVVFAGRIAAPKGVGVLIRAARDVDAEFVLCGDGRELDAMRRLARNLGVQQRVRFAGWLAAAELAREFADASVVAVPSLWPEPFGLVGIEALAASRPVVASLTGGVGDWLRDGVSGLGVAPGDPRALARALDELLADPERQRTMGLAGARDVAARFSPERHVAALLEGYRAACAHWQSATHAGRLAIT
jgi:glycosyltransferase involved in cell wall biosynthesis